MQQQRLIELIRVEKVTEALAFAQEELAPRGLEHPDFLNDLEQTLALLLMGGDSPVSHLLQKSHRTKVSNIVNAAILTALSVDKEAKLPALINWLEWAQNRLEEKMEFPRIKNYVTAE